MVPRRRKQKKLPTKVVDDESEDIESPEPTAGEDVDLSAYDSSDEDRREGQPDRPKEENRRCLPTAEELVRKHLATGILPKDMAGLEVTTIEAERRSTAPLDGVGQEDSQDQTPVLSAFGVMVPAWVNGRLAAEYITPTSLPEMHMSVSDWRTMGIPIGLAKLIEASVRTKRPRAGEPEEQDDPEVKRTRLAERKVPMSRPDWLQAIEGKDLDDGKPFVSMFEKQMAVHKWAEDNWPQLFLLTFPRPGSAEDTRWPRAREWIQAATNAGELENWEKTKESFLKSFKSVVGQRVQLLNELHKAHQKKDETVQGFINRLLNVASRYNIEPEGPHNLVDYLMRGVNVEIRQAMHREVQARQIDTDQVNWTMAVELANLTERWVTTKAFETAKEDERWASRSTVARATAPPIPSSPAASSSSSSSGVMAKRCHIHKDSGDHTTRSCRQYIKWERRLRAQNVEPIYEQVVALMERTGRWADPRSDSECFRLLSVPMGYDATKDYMHVARDDSGMIVGRGLMSRAQSIPPRTEALKCFRCKEYGHRAVSCPAPYPVSDPPNPMMPTSMRGRGDASLRGRGEVSMRGMGVSRGRATPTMQPLYTPSGYSPEYIFDQYGYRVILNVGGREVRAEVDPGSSHSMMDASCFETMGDQGVELTEELLGRAVGVNGHGESNTVKFTKSTNVLEVSDGRRTVHHAFLVGKIGAGGVDVLVGRDLNAKLGYAVIGIPFRIPVEQQKLLTKQDMETDLRTRACDEHVDRARIVDAVQEAIERNQEVTGFCTHPESRIQFTIPTSVKLPWVPQYPLSREKTVKVDEAVTNWIANGRVEPAAEVVMNLPLNGAAKRHPVTGEKSDVRTNFDGRKLNEILKENGIMEFPNYLPRIDEVFERLAGCQVLTVLDAADAYPSCEIESKTRRYFQFSWRGQRWQFRGMPFGLHFMTSKFQKLMITMLNEHGIYCIVFVDDIIIFSNNVDEHVRHVRAVINTLTRWNMKIKVAKTQIGYRNLFALGHKVGTDGVQIDRRKLIGVDEWIPPTARTIEHYLGLFNYFRKFIPTYAVVLEPLERVRKNFVWGSEQEDSWQKAKTLLLNAPILHFPSWNQRFYLAVDGSLEGLSAVLFQFKDPQDDREWRSGQKKFLGAEEPPKDVKIIAMKSRATKSHERKYSQNKIETAALVYGLYQYYPYLSSKEFTVFTDHEALVWLLNKEEVNRTVSGWIDVIMEFQFEIVHIPGIRNVLPDILSRIYPIKNIRGDEVQVVAPVRRRKESQPMFEAMPNVVEVHRLKVVCRYDLSSLAEIRWTKRSLVRPKRPKKKKTTKERIPEELVTALEVVFGKMSRPDLLGDKGLEMQWNQMNLVHPRADRDGIERWLRKGLTESDQRGSVSVFLLPEWKKKRWFRALSGLAQMYFFKYPIRFEPYLEASPYRSILVIITPEVAKQISDENGLRFHRIELAERIMRKLVTDEQEQRRLIQQYHARGHFGITQVFRSITADGYRWPSMLVGIKEEVQNCADCRRYVVKQEGFHPLQPIHAKLPMDHIAVDCWQMTTSIDGYTYGLVIVDVCTRFVILRGLRSCSSVSVARKLYKLFCLLGFPKIIQSDNGTEFRNELIGQLTKMVNADHRFTTPYHPRGNGLAEAAVKIVKQTLLRTLRGALTDWHRRLPAIQFQINLKIAALHKSSPFSLFYARKSNQFNDYSDCQGNLMDHEELEHRLAEMTELIFPNVSEAARNTQDAWKERFDKKSNLTTIPEGALVMTRVVERGSKLNPRYEGPFTVLRRTRGGSYSLLDTDGKMLPRNYSPSQVQMVKMPDAKDQKSTSETFEVKEVRDHRRKGDGSGFEYLVHWKGYDSDDDTWEPEEHFHDISEITRYMKKVRQRGISTDSPDSSKRG